MEIVGGHQHDVTRKGLIEPGVDFPTALGVEVGVAEAGKEELIDRRRPEALRVGEAQPRLGGRQHVTGAARGADGSTEALEREIMTAPSITAST